MKRTPGQHKIHASIKKRLGYASEEADREVLKDWKERLRRVCKPCWELKYCPYGPLVEQAPLLPPLLADVVSGIEYKKNCLKTGTLGKREKLDDERRGLYGQLVASKDLLIRQAIIELGLEQDINAASEEENPLQNWVSEDLPPIHIYRVPYNRDCEPIDLSHYDVEKRAAILDRVAIVSQKYNDALETGVDDLRKPLDPVRRHWFEKEVAEFNRNNYPERIPQTFEDGVCNIFGHICPVFFSAEAITETTTERRRGRYIPFAMKMRIVRRDNHTCQLCGIHLRDNEVEFDHIIPIARGDSSEEHNIRLTCFVCNRDKKDKINI
jgi:hypothetical protein